MKKRDDDNETQEQKEEKNKDADSQKGEIEVCMQEKTSHTKPGWKGDLAVNVIPPPAKAFVTVAGPRKQVKTAQLDKGSD